MTAAHTSVVTDLATATDVAAFVRESEGGIRIVGAGTWLEAGHSVNAAHTLRLTGTAGVRHYVPDDLTISVGAGTTLAELRAATAAHGQWCALESWGDDRATVGAVVATATDGPFARALGRPRDLVLGIECVDGLGRIIRAGGRVVKNVAGFDLTRLVTGAWGTLGIITEVHVRLRALSTADETLLVRVEDAAARARLDEFTSGPYAPLGCHRASEAVMPERDGGGERWIVRIAGNARFVAAARAALAAVGDCAPLGVNVWADVRRLDGPPERAKAWRWNPLSRELKRRFDPVNKLNPGLLGDAVIGDPS